MSRLRVTQALLLGAALVNLAPILGVFSVSLISQAYGIPEPRGDLLILMQHRALLFGIVGGLLAASAFKPHLQPAAILFGLISMIGFIVLALIGAPTGSEIQRIALVDGIASVALIVVIWLRRAAISALAQPRGHHEERSA